MEHVPDPLRFLDALILLAAIGIVVPLAQRLRVNAVLAYLLVGAAIGPAGLGQLGGDVALLRLFTVTEIDEIKLLAEFGIVFLLFMLGLEVSAERLWLMRRLVLGLGMLQFLLTAALGAGAAVLLGLVPLAAAIVGACLAFSSTAIVMELLAQRRAVATPAGRAAFGILLLQDLAVVPVLFLVGIAAGHDGGDGTLAEAGWALGKAVLVVAVIVIAGRYGLRPLLRLVGQAQSPETFAAAILLAVSATALATGAAGLSMALGAFLAGMLLAESEYRHQVEVTIEPFKGILLGLFFMSVGMEIDPVAMLRQWPILLAGLAGVLVVKATIIGGLLHIFGYRPPVALETAILLAQVGEFAFVVIGLAVTGGTLPAETGTLLIALAGLSMLATPPLSALARHWSGRLRHHEGAAMDTTEENEQSGHVILAGFGRVGRTLARILEAEQQAWVALDHNAETVAACRRHNQPVHFGDASRPDLLRRAGAGEAQALIVTLDDARDAGRMVAAAHREWPDLPIYARARDAAHARDLLLAGATDVVAEASEASLQLGGRVLTGLGLPHDVVQQRLALERECERGIIERPQQ